VTALQAIEFAREMALVRPPAAVDGMAGHAGLGQQIADAPPGRDAGDDARPVASSKAMRRVSARRRAWRRSAAKAGSARAQ
jgi:hypothetical protein